MPAVSLLQNLMSKLVNLVAGSDEIPQIDTHWFSESGVIDIFFMLGPEPRDVFRQYAALTGTTPLPPVRGQPRLKTACLFLIR